MFTSTLNLLSQSLEKAQEIFNRSEHLSAAGAQSNVYTDRVPYLEELLGEEGHVSFHPDIRKDLTVEFRNSLNPDLEKKSNEYYSTTYDSYEEDRRNRELVYLSTELRDVVTNEDLLSNTVPKSVVAYIEARNIKGFNSPKLSKMLVKLFGQGSEVVKWYTNKCPKKLEKGIVRDYKVHLSILPHHIAGMSYYAPSNWGGAEWETGWRGTSCMDTIRNGDGSSIYELVPNLLDSTLAIAYLTSSDDDDLFEPRYQARLLVRVAKVNENDHVLVGLRTYYTNNEIKYYLVEGLKSQFDNFVHVEDLRVYENDREFIGKKNFITNVCVKWNLEKSREECDDCDGSGHDWEGDECATCDGTGYVEEDNPTYYPYVDDPEFLKFTGSAVKVKLPVAYLVAKGYMEKPEPEPSLESAISLAC